ncbi:Metallo-dependent hydrolase [Paxillus ammoniavirescens]|nr:Metallo-dependent hydrolase [Paxillus ammoniavirescens]
MGKNKKSHLPNEKYLSLPAHAEAAIPIVDTHTHLLSTFSSYRSKYTSGKYDTVWDFVRGIYAGRNVKAIVDVWCEAPVQSAWKELADSAITPEDRAEKWGGIEYWFVMGVHPHEASVYTDAVEKSILEAMAHPRCVGWGEIGLDYHYDNSPRQIQQQVFTRQLRQAVKLGKPLTIHTREAEEDTERILKQEVPIHHKIHIHCFTDSPEFAQRLLDHFPNLHIGITGVISYSTNVNTSALVRQMVASPGGPRILLETDAPYMIPANLYASLPEVKGRLPLCHTAMIPWVADFTAGAVGDGWGTAKIMQRANKNAQLVYGI